MFRFLFRTGGIPLAGEFLLRNSLTDYAARITALSTTMIKRLENIFAVALDEDRAKSAAAAAAATATGAETADATMPTSSDPSLPPSLIDTSTQQFQLDVESTALVRAAEEIMMLTRTMKEIWLFGGLDTLTKDNDKDKNPENEALRKKMDEDVRVVEEGFKRFLDRFEVRLDGDGGEVLEAQR